MLTDDYQTENVPQGLRERSTCGEAVRPNTNGTDDRRASSKQETSLVRVGITSPLGDCEDVNLYYYRC
jgi:hypothetical protein